MLTITAVHHALEASRGEGDVLRHELFVGIDALLALLLVARPRWSLVPTAVLAVQQGQSHGSELLRSIRDPLLPFDWASLAALAFFPALLAVIVIEARAHHDRRRT